MATKPVFDEAQLKHYRDLFDSFDKDSSGAVDANELSAMCESLGMIVNPADIASMIEAADEDNSGQIEFDEFLEVIHRVASEGVSAKKGAISLDSLVSRKANAGPPMLWRIDKAGPGLAIDAERTEACRMGERTGPQWGVQLVDLWLGQKTYDLASIILEFSAPLPGEVYVGIVGRNFNAGDWDVDPSESKHAVVFSASSGKQFHKGREVANGSLVKFGCKRTDCRIQLELNLGNQSMVCSVLGSSSGAQPVATVDIDDLPPEVAVAVAFGPSALNSLAACRVVGSSCERADKKPPPRPDLCHSSAYMNDSRINGTRA